MSAKRASGLPKLSYSVAEAAEVTGVSPDTIKRAIRARHLKARRSAVDANGVPAGKYLIFHADLIAWLEGLEAA